MGPYYLSGPLGNENELCTRVSGWQIRIHSVIAASTTHPAAGPADTVDPSACKEIEMCWPGLALLHDSRGIPSWPARCDSGLRTPRRKDSRLLSGLRGTSAEAGRLRPERGTPGLPLGTPPGAASVDSAESSGRLGGFDGSAEDGRRMDRRRRTVDSAILSGRRAAFHLIPSPLHPAHPAQGSMSS